MHRTLLAILASAICLAPAPALAQSTETTHYYVIRYWGYADDARISYVSDTLVHNGYRACDRMDTSAFKAKARMEFWKHLQANYDFNGSPNNIAAEPTFGVASRQELQEVVTRFVAKERQEGRQVVRTDYRLHCG